MGRVEHGSHCGWGEPHHNLHCEHHTCTALKAAGAGFTCRLCICTVVWLWCGNTMVYHRNYLHFYSQVHFQYTLFGLAILKYLNKFRHVNQILPTPVTEAQDCTDG